jgi:hypothetical protein
LVLGAAVESCRHPVKKKDAAWLHPSFLQGATRASYGVLQARQYRLCGGAERRHTTKILGAPNSLAHRYRTESFQGVEARASTPYCFVATLRSLYPAKLQKITQHTNFSENFCKF